MAGKGDKWRGGWTKVYKDNYDNIFKKEKKMILKGSSSLILRGGNLHMVNVPHKYWKEKGWKLNDEVEIECTEDVITIRRKSETKK